MKRLAFEIAVDSDKKADIGNWENQTTSKYFWLIFMEMCENKSFVKQKSL